MAFISELIGNPVTDIDGVLVGKLEDLIASQPNDFPHPLITAIKVRTEESSELIIPVSQTAVIIAPAIPLLRKKPGIEPYTPVENDIFLVRDVMDKQIVDMDGARVVRVNDVEIIRVNTEVVVSNVDVGASGIVRRLGLSHTFSGVYKFFKKPLPTELISWDDVELLAGDQGILLKTSPKKLAELYPADLADILMDMNQLQGGKFIEHLDVSQIADALENVETDYQTRLLESMDNEKVADVLEEMAPDDAADLLAELPEERSAALLKLMEGDEAEDVRKLLKYEDDTAGGLMTTDYVTAPLTATAEEVICQLREIGEEIETLYYVYVTDTDNVLTGIFSLSDLILALPQTPVSEFMRKRVTSVLLEDSQDEVARIVAKYNLLAVPVVDEGDHLHGIVTSDDALDKIIPTSWKKRLPRYY